MRRSVLTTLKRLCAFTAGAAIFWGCSSVKHVPEGEYLVDNVDIHIEESDGEIRSADLVNYLRQTPNHKVLGFLKLQLATYSLSGADTTKWYNRWLRRLGQPPVIYDPALTTASTRQLRQALVNKGYMDAVVTADTVADPIRRRIDVTYNVSPGTPHRISSLAYDIPDSAIAELVMADSALFTLRPGDLFDRTSLDAERSLITNRLRNKGYYAFTKEYITFIADTAEFSEDVDLVMTIHPPRHAATNLEGNGADSIPRHHTYIVRNVYFVTDYRPGDDTPAPTDTVGYRGIDVIYGPDHYIKPSALEEKCFIRPGHKYSSIEADRTYQALSQLGILRSINIEMVPVGTLGTEGLLDAYIYLSRNKKQGITLELEGTNSEGDLGFGVGITYLHRNLGHVSDLLTTKFRVNYESLSGNVSGLINNRYTEFAAETGITFPKFQFPFLSRSFKQRVKATTELALSFNYQERPEYTRIIAGAAWKYRWTAHSGRERRTFDLVDLNYVYLPESTIDFINQIAPSNPLLRYSYEDHFILRTGYTYYRTNRRIASATDTRRTTRQPIVYSLRAAGETAGNLLYAISSLSGQKRHDDVYRLFGIQYSQYAKAEFDYSIARNFADRHSLAFHVGAGIGVPYGNSRVLPFEKRFYAGGANGVRGWGVRTLGPGSYDARNSVTDFINQCGDISLLLNIEYRCRLFWVFEGAVFADAGNIWTIHNYENQPGGMFHFSTFWRQIAASYGAGLRLDFSYFLLRFDLGLKAHNPAMSQEHWPIIHPRWGRDATFHFSVGYPF
ncbi:MAG: BamA/TamA family outer membrane protein [Bacteroides sp.]|nr:BamA/TamA family outer membrane protein [Bacteroides sp.]